jgi:hypothetical protein
VTGGAARIPIAHVAAEHVLRFTGTMTLAQRTSLLDDTGAALASLRAASQLVSMDAVRGWPSRVASVAG